MTLFLRDEEIRILLLALEVLAKAQTANTDVALDLYKYIKTGVRE